jgi:hypothetical protein
MTKKVISFLVVAAMFLMASCSASPQKRYATEMEPAIELLVKWQSDFADFQTLLNDSASSSSGIAPIQIIEFYNIATQYTITKDDYKTMGFSPLDAIVNPAVELSTDGKNILNIISIVTPVEEIQAAHEAIVKCVQMRVGLTEELSSAITALRPIDLSQIGDASDCDTFDAAFGKLTTFVDDNK